MHPARLLATAILTTRRKARRPLRRSDAHLVDDHSEGVQSLSVRLTRLGRDLGERGEGVQTLASGLRQG